MNIYVMALVIFLTAFAVIGGAAWLTGRKPGICDRCGHEAGWCRCPCCQARVPLARLADPRPLPGELPIAGRLPVEQPFDLMNALAQVPALVESYGPFPVDTGPLLILSEQAAAEVALEREIRQRCAEAEAKIPPRWR